MLFVQGYGNEGRRTMYHQGDFTKAKYMIHNTQYDNRICRIIGDLSYRVTNNIYLKRSVRLFNWTNIDASSNIALKLDVLIYYKYISYSWFFFHLETLLGSATRSLIKNIVFGELLRLKATLCRPFGSIGSIMNFRLQIFSALDMRVPFWSAHFQSLRFAFLAAKV